MNEWSDNLPDETTITYKDKTMKLKLFPLREHREKYKLIGYNVDACPVCGKGMMLSTRNHMVTANEQGQITAMPSLVCPHQCGWHVWVKDGIATDC